MVLGMAGYLLVVHARNVSPAAVIVLAWLSRIRTDSSSLLLCSGSPVPGWKLVTGDRVVGAAPFFQVQGRGGDAVASSTFNLRVASHRHGAPTQSGALPGHAV